MKKVIALAAFALLSPIAAFAQGDSIEISKPAFTLFHEFGKFERGVEFDKSVFKDYWVQRTGVFLTFSAKKNERLTLDVVLGGIYWNPTYNENGSSENVLRYFAATAPKIDVGYAFGDPKAPFLKVNGGVFQYKYNEYVRNLGEYMYRTAAYPGLVYNGALTYVDVNKPQVTGLKITHNLGKMFSHDLLLTTETENLPHYDLNLAYMAKFNWNNVVKINAGVKFARIISIAPEITNPDIKNNRYFTFDGTTYIENPDYYAQRLTYLTNHPGTASVVDSSLWERGRYLADTLRTMMIFDTSLSFTQALANLQTALGVTTPSSYSHYDASSITPVVSFSFDPKPLLGLSILGSKDLVIYAEAALLGTKNYPILYEKAGERLVTMVGVNIPTFKLLDVLAVEVEKFGSRIPNSSQNSQRDIGKIDGILQPIPQPSIYPASLPDGYSPDDWKKDDMKWSVLAQRSITKGLSLTTQLASDNSRGWIYPSGRRYWNLFREPSDWYWMFKITANI